MRWSWHAGLIIALMCLLMFAAASGVSSAEKRIMIAVTADTQGEINPCG